MVVTMEDVLDQVFAVVISDIVARLVMKVC